MDKRADKQPIPRAPFYFLLIFAALLLQTIGLPTIAAADQPPPGKQQVKFICPMHPHYIADDKGTCPICGMDLVQKGKELSGKDGAAPITIAPETIQNIGVRRARVEKAFFGRAIRSYGIVEENERQRSEISSRIEGWVEKINVTAVGDVVREGDELFRVYSPELIVSQRDYINGLKAGNKTIISAVEQRLRSFGVQSKALAGLRRERKIMNELPFYAPRDGTISELKINQGSYLRRGMMVAKIQDYSKVWLVVSVAEKDLAFISKNTKARIIFPNTGMQEVVSKVDYVYPTINKSSRTGRVRLIVENPDGKIRPGAYADIIFEVGVKQRLSAPTEAILRRASGSYIIIALSDGRFEPRAIRTGLVSGSETEIIEGLSEGEEIVISGQFLLDSESALNESFHKFSKPAEQIGLLNLTKTELAVFDHLTDAALYLHETLLANKFPDQKFLQPAAEIKRHLWPRYGATSLGPILVQAETAVKMAQKAKTNSQIKAALNDLTVAISPFILRGAPGHYQAKKISIFQSAGDGSKWVQLGQTPKNPFDDKRATALPFSKAMQQAKQKVKTKSSPDKSMRGSHGNH